MRLLDRIPFAVLIPVALLFLLTPFSPQPHLVEKIILLTAGELTRPLDVFDLLFHLLPGFLLILKIIMRKTRSESQSRSL